MAVPELWILAGPNGAGKTSGAQRKPIASLLPGVRFLNPDDRTLIKLRAAGYQGFADAPAEVQRQLFIESAIEGVRRAGGNHLPGRTGWCRDGPQFR